MLGAMAYVPYAAAPCSTPCRNAFCMHMQMHRLSDLHGILMHLLARGHTFREYKFLVKVLICSLTAILSSVSRPKPATTSFEKSIAMSPICITLAGKQHARPTVIDSHVSVMLSLQRIDTCLSMAAVSRLHHLTAVNSTGGADRLLQVNRLLRCPVFQPTPHNLL